MQSIINALLNMFLVSFPEELFVVAVVLIGIKKDDLLDIRMLKFNLKWVFLPAIITSIVVTFGKFTNIPNSYIKISSVIILYLSILVIIINNNITKNKIEHFKIFYFTMLGFAITAILESYYPLILSLTKTSIIYINSHFIYNLLCSLPARAMEYSILTYLLVKRRDDIRIKLFDTILKKKFLKLSMISLLIGIIITIIFLIELIGVDLILIKLSFLKQLIIIIMMFIIPTITITLILLIINYTLKSEKRMQQTYENLSKLDDVMFDVED